MMLATIRRRDGAWFAGRAREPGGDAPGCALFGSRDDRARLVLFEAEAAASALLTELHDVAILIEPAI